MSWRKHFTAVNNSGLPMGPTGSDSYGATHTRSASFLPEIYAGSPNRMQRYVQFSNMDNDHSIAIALDTIAEFGTQEVEYTDLPFELKFNDEPTESENKVITKALEQWCNLNEMHRRIFRIFRSTCKFGDQFFMRDPETYKLYWIDPANVEKVLINEYEGNKIEAYFIKDISPKFESLTATNIATLHNRSYGSGQGYTGVIGTVNPIASNFLSGNQTGVSAGMPIAAKHVVHISLGEGMDVHWPFGASILEPVFKVFKQKELLEDSIIIYRVHRAPERRVFFIDVGNMAPHKARQYLEQVRYEVQQKRVPSMDSEGNPVSDAAYNPMCLDLSTRIPLLDGRTLELNQLIDEYRSGKENWVYSTNPETGRVVPGNITWAGITRRNTETIKITLDNGKTLTCTPDHKIPVLGRGFVEAKDLTPDDPLISFETRDKSLSKDKNRSYQQVYDHELNKWVFTHRMVAEFFHELSKHQTFVFSEDFVEAEKNCVHHCDYDRYNNDPRNLQWMNINDHRLYHSFVKKEYWENISSDEAERIKDKIRTSLAKYREENPKEFLERYKNRDTSWIQRMKEDDPEKYAAWRASHGRSKSEYLQKNPDALRKLIDNGSKVLREKGAKNQNLNFTQPMLTRLVEIVKEHDSNRLKTIAIVNNDEKFMSLLKSANPVVEKSTRNVNNEKFTNSKLKRMYAKFGYKNWKDFKNKTKVYNHRIVSIEKVENRDVGTITVDFQEKWHDYHTFAIEAGIFIKNSMLEDYFFAQTADGRGSKVDTLPGGDNLGCFTLDTKVKLLDGRDLSIAEIGDEISIGANLWTYSAHPITGEVVPGKISWAGKTKSDQRVIKITLDNGESIQCTLDHKFPILGKGFVSAADLEVGTSLMPIYTRCKQLSEHKKLDYEQVYCNHDKEWKYTHRMIMQFLKNSGIYSTMVFNEALKDKPKDTIHHVNHNRYDNSPENLTWMNFKDHSQYHAHHGFSPDAQSLGSQAALAKLLDLKENSPDEYAALIKKQIMGREKWRASLSDAEKEKISARISSSLKSFFESDRYTPNMQAARRERNAQNAVRGGMRYKWLIENDAEFNEMMSELISEGISSSKQNNPLKWNARSEKIARANIARWKTDGYYDKVFESQKLKFNARMFSMLTEIYNNSSALTMKQLQGYLESNRDFMNEFASINSVTHTNSNVAKFEPRKIKALLGCFGLTWNQFKISQAKIVMSDQVTDLQKYAAAADNQTQFVSMVSFEVPELNSRFKIMNQLKEAGFDDYSMFAEFASYKNHRIVAIEDVPGLHDVGTLTIDADELLHDYHTYALSAGVFTKNSIDDLRYFKNELMRGLRVPSSYLPSGPEDGNAQYSDGKVGIAYIQEYRFSKYVERLQRQIIDPLDREFKLYLKFKGIEVDAGNFYIKLTEPMNFTAYRDLQVDTEKANLYGALEGAEYLSKRFLLKRFLRLSDSEIKENEELWSEENPSGESPPGKLKDSDLRGSGVIPRPNIEVDADAEISDNDFLDFNPEDESEDIEGDAAEIDMEEQQ
jgi:intein/homing endonuclease